MQLSQGRNHKEVSICVIEGQDPGRGRERLGEVEMKLFPGVGGGGGKRSQQGNKGKKGRKKEKRSREEKEEKEKGSEVQKVLFKKYRRIISYLTRVSGPRDASHSRANSGFWGADRLGLSTPRL